MLSFRPALDQKIILKHSFSFHYKTLSIEWFGFRWSLVRDPVYSNSKCFVVPKFYIAISLLQLPFETEVYFIQHTLMMIIPYYLLRIGGEYTDDDYTILSSQNRRWVHWWWLYHTIFSEWEVSTLMMIIPYYLLRIGGEYTDDDYTILSSQNRRWVLMMIIPYYFSE